MKLPDFRIPYACIALMTVVCAAPALGAALTYTISDQNSQATIVPTSQAGMNSWTVDGVDDLAQQWFWYSIGSGSASSLDTLALSGTSQPASNQVSFSYTGSLGLAATVSYILTGGAPGSFTSDVSESIKLQNTTGGSMGVHFYQYSNYQLGGAGSGNVLMFSNTNTVDQTSSTSLAETVDAPAASRYQGGAYPSLLTLLNGGSQVTLNDTPAFGTPLGPGNMSWAYEWDKTLNAGATFLIVKDKNIAPVPEPGTLALLGAGAVVLLGFARQRLRRLAH